jgi:membrane protease YdiL (CAAX protease family)
MDPAVFYVFFIFTLIFKLASAIWVYNDGKDRDENMAFWILFIFLTLVLGLLFWFSVRRRTKDEENAYQYWYGPQAQEYLRHYQPIRSCIDCNKEIPYNEYRCEDCKDNLLSNKIRKITNNPLSITNVLFVLIASQIIGGFLAFSAIFILIISPNLEQVLSDPNAMIDLVLSPGSILITVIFSNGTMIILTYFRAIRPKDEPRISLSEIGWKIPDNASLLIKWFLIGLCMVMLIWAFEIFLLPESDESTALFLPDNFYEYILLIIGTAIIVPIGEEFFFRGYAFAAVDKNWDTYGAYAFSAILFAVLHFTIIGLLPLFIIGLIFAYILKKTGSLLPCLILHGLNNFVAVSLLFWYN